MGVGSMVVVTGARAVEAEEVVVVIKEVVVEIEDVVWVAGVGVTTGERIAGEVKVLEVVVVVVMIAGVMTVGVVVLISVVVCAKSGVSGINTDSCKMMKM